MLMRNIWKLESMMETQKERGNIGAYVTERMMAVNRFFLK